MTFFIIICCHIYIYLLEPSVGPEDVSFTELNMTTFNISWSPLTREKSYGKVISYEVNAELLSTGRRRKRSPANNKAVNTTSAFVIMHGIHRCYSVSVRAYTNAGSGPFSQPLSLEKSSECHLDSKRILILISLIQALYLGSLLYYKQAY